MSSVTKIKLIAFFSIGLFDYKPILKQPNNIWPHIKFSKFSDSLKIFLVGLGAVIAQKSTEEEGLNSKNGFQNFNSPLPGGSSKTSMGKAFTTARG